MIGFLDAQPLRWTAVYLFVLLIVLLLTVVAIELGESFAASRRAKAEARDRAACPIPHCPVCKNGPLR
jgi:hypothetical protein